MNKKTIKIIITIILIFIILYFARILFILFKINNCKNYIDIVKVERKYVYNTKNPIIKSISRNKLIDYIIEEKEINDDYMYLGEYYDKTGTEEYNQHKNIDTVPSKKVNFVSIYFKDKNNVYIIPTEKTNYKSLTNKTNFNEYKDYSYKIKGADFYIEKYEKRDYDSDNFNDADDNFKYNTVDTTIENHIVLKLESSSDKNIRLSFYVVNHGEMIYIYNFNSESSIFDTKIYYDYARTNNNLAVSSDVNDFISKYENLDDDVANYSKNNVLTKNLDTNIIGEWKILDDSEVYYIITKEKITIYDSYKDLNDNYLSCEYKEKIGSKSVSDNLLYYFYKNGLENEEDLHTLTCDNYEAKINGKEVKYNSSLSIMTIIKKNQLGEVNAAAQFSTGKVTNNYNFMKVKN